MLRQLLLIAATTFAAHSSIFANPVTDIGLPSHPEAFELEKRANEQVPNASDITYQVESATGDDILDFYLRNIPDTKWNLTGLQNNSVKQFSTYQVSLSLTSDDEKSFTQLVILQQDEGPPAILITYLPSIADPVAARNTTSSVDDKPPQKTDLERWEETGSVHNALPLIKTYINEKNYQALQELSSDYFQSRADPELLKLRLAETEIKSIDTHFVTSRNNLSTAVVDVVLQNERGRQTSKVIMYFNRENGKWKFNHLPFDTLLNLQPDCLVDGFN